MELEFKSIQRWKSGLKMCFFKFDWENKQVSIIMEIKDRIFP